MIIPLESLNNQKATETTNLATSFGRLKLRASNLLAASLTKPNEA